MNKHPQPDAVAALKLAYRVNEAEAVSGLSRSTLYELIAQGKLPDVKVAGRRLIPREPLRRLVTGEAGQHP